MYLIFFVNSNRIEPVTTLIVISVQHSAVVPMLPKVNIDIASYEEWKRALVGLYWLSDELAYTMNDCA